MADILSTTARRALASTYFVVVFINMSSLLISYTESKPLCQPGYYHDSVTRNCDHCSDICDQAIQQGTVEKCQQMCPEYNQRERRTDRECDPMEYYDENVDRCEPCTSVCMNTYDSETCKKRCPGWPYSAVISKKGNGNDSLIRSEHNGNTTYSNKSVAAVYIIIAVAALVLIVVIVGVGVCIYIARSFNNKEGGPAPRFTVCKRRPQQAVQRESHEMDSLTARGDPLSHPEDETGEF